MVYPVEAELPMRSILKQVAGEEMGRCNKLSLVAKEGKVTKGRQPSRRDSRLQQVVGGTRGHVETRVEWGLQ